MAVFQSHRLKVYVAFRSLKLILLFIFISFKGYCQQPLTYSDLIKIQKATNLSNLEDFLMSKGFEYILKNNHENGQNITGYQYKRQNKITFEFETIRKHIRETPTPVNEYLEYITNKDVYLSFKKQMTTLGYKLVNSYSADDGLDSGGMRYQYSNGIYNIEFCNAEAGYGIVLSIKHENEPVNVSN